MTVLLQAEHVAVSGAQGIVRPVSFVLHAGRPLTILGETGSGKSLLAQAIMGTLPKGLRGEGTVVIAGERFELSNPSRPQARLWGKTISLLPQEPWLALDPTMRAALQIEEGYVHVRGQDRATARISSEADLRILGLEGSGRKLPSELSGGMAQRVAFAAARAGGAQIVIADEPTKGLDAARRDGVAALLAREVTEGGGLLTITHDLALARGLGGDIAIMLDGEIVEQGETVQVLKRPMHAYTKRLVAADPSTWTDRTRRHDYEKCVLSAQGLSKTRGGRLLFSGQSLDLHAGEIVGVTGPSGCGKSTLGDIMLNLVRPDSGQVIRAGCLAATRFQKLYQDPPSAFPQRVTIGRALDDLMHLHRLDRHRTTDLMKRLRLSPDLLDRLAGEVSGGELQRFALLRVLLLDPVFLFADEPTSRLDLVTQQETIDLIVEIARERGCSVLVVSHDIELISKISDRRLEL